MNPLPSNLLQVIVACTLLCVWLIQPKKPTPYRGGNAKTLAEEFQAYGLPQWCLYLVGTLKVGASLALLAGIWIRPLVFPAAVVLVILMVSAIAMHVKIADPIKKSLPAAALLIFCAVIAFLAFQNS